MSFVDNNGLSHFLTKLKERFILKQADGEGGYIDKVALADNLYSEDTITLNDKFYFRTSGGAMDIFSGEATLESISGNMLKEGFEDESFDIQPVQGVKLIVNSLATWRTTHTEAGDYDFEYTVPTPPSSSVSSWSPTETWSPSLSSNGLQSNGVIQPNLVISAGQGTPPATINPATWTGIITEAGEYTFTYVTEIQDEESRSFWTLNDIEVLLNTYGLSSVSNPSAGDNFTIIYTKGNLSSNITITITYQPQVTGTIYLPKPTKFQATSFNQFNKNSSDFYLEHATISNGTVIVNNQFTTYVCFCKAVGGLEYGYMAYSESGAILIGNNANGAGWCATIPENGSTIYQDKDLSDLSGDKKDINTEHQSTIHFSQDGYVVVAVSNKDDLCIHTRWDTEDDETFEEYEEPSEIILPEKGIYNNVLEYLPLRLYGMPAVGQVSDKLNLVDGIYIQRIGRIENNDEDWQSIVGDSDYEYDTEYTYYVLSSPKVYTNATVDSKYMVNDMGTESFIFNEGDAEVKLEVNTVYGENLRNKLKNSVFTITKQTPELSENQQSQVLQNLGWTYKIM